MKKGFTLAEVLITLGIIGVVAAMTIPTLVANYQKKVFVSQLQKTVATVTNATKLLMADEQAYNLSQTYLYNEEYSKEAYENSVGRFLKTYFKVVKTCNRWDNNMDECTYDELYKNIKDEEPSSGATNNYCGVLSSGAVICLTPIDEYPITLDIDVNGKNGPNTWGRDAFNLSINSNGTIAESFDKTQWSINARMPSMCGYGRNDTGSAVGYGAGCYNKIVQDGWKMDY